MNRHTASTEVMVSGNENPEELLAVAAEHADDEDQYWTLIDRLARLPPARLSHSTRLAAQAQDDKLRAAIADWLAVVAARSPAAVSGETLNALRNWLSEPGTSSETLSAVLSALRRARATSAADAVVMLAEHDDPEVREQVAQTLAALLEEDPRKHDAGLTTLLRAARDNVSTVREWATAGIAALLAAHDDPELRETLEALASDPAKNVRCEALGALARSGERWALRLALRECDADRRLLEAAMRAGPDEQLHLALSALAASDDWLGDRQLLQRALAATQPPARGPSEDIAFLIFVDDNGLYRWRLQRGDGRALAESSVAYRDKDVALRALQQLASAVAGAGIRERHNERRVVPHPDGGWRVVVPGNARASGHFPRQRDAIARAREIVRNTGGGEVIVHGRDGRIRDRDTVPAGRKPGRSKADGA
jgi:uncharacterized protein YegP (UPF0339 family)/HEAT repeat protein